MDRIDLSYFATKYPMPEGVRRLMPFQELPFNGDGYAAAEVLRLKEKHGLTWAVETGTCYGSTSLFFGEHFPEVVTFEIDKTSHDIACQRLQEHVSPVNMNSVVGMVGLEMDDRFIYFGDAHWLHHCPLLKELKAIADQHVRPVIMIHDFQVPGRPDLGFDRFPDTGNPFNLEAIAPYLDKIYGKDGWDHHYNDEAEGARRGIIYIEPK